MTKKRFLVLFLILAIGFIILNLISIASKELKDITFSNFSVIVGPFLACISVFIAYRSEINKEAK